ncbi:hypothetical protein [Spirochaeta cellobiosiphila]|uniref:hypothetical protein n=1 Tax=Spirochaeta cellobiosiphila TaxID=504483 RepID=UPI00041251FA|nr:hypothetical protein [Spirochaeta cellobiosiphila]
MSTIAYSILDEKEAADFVQHLKALEAKIDIIQSRSFLTKEWYSREEVAEMKGYSINLVSTQPLLLPNFGVPHRLSQGKWGFHWKEVAEWLPKDYDQILAEYEGQEP